MKWTFLIYLIILVVAILLVGSIGSDAFQIVKNITSGVNITSVCEAWDCKEPIPSILYENVDDCKKSITSCIEYCKKKSPMPLCPPELK